MSLVVAVTLTDIVPVEDASIKSEVMSAAATPVAVARTVLNEAFTTWAWIFACVASVAANKSGENEII